MGKHFYASFVCKRPKMSQGGLIVENCVWIQTIIINANYKFKAVHETTNITKRILVLEQTLTFYVIKFVARVGIYIICALQRNVGLWSLKLLAKFAAFVKWMNWDCLSDKSDKFRYSRRLIHFVAEQAHICWKIQLESSQIPRSQNFPFSFQTMREENIMIFSPRNVALQLERRTKENLWKENRKLLNLIQAWNLISSKSSSPFQPFASRSLKVVRDHQMVSQNRESFREALIGIFFSGYSELFMF